MRTISRNSSKKLSDKGVNVEKIQGQIKEKQSDSGNHLGRVNSGGIQMGGLLEQKGNSKTDRHDIKSHQKNNTIAFIKENNMNNLYKDKSDLNKIGIALYSDGKYAEAEDYYKLAIEIDPKFKAALNNLGNARRKQKNYDGALEAYYKVLEIDPKCKEAYNGIGNALDVQKRFPEAIESYKQAIIIDPQYKGAYNNMGNALENMKLYSDAIDKYRIALEIDPSDKTAIKNLKRCQTKQLETSNSGMM